MDMDLVRLVVKETDLDRLTVRVIDGEIVKERDGVRESVRVSDGLIVTDRDRVCE